MGAYGPEEFVIPQRRWLLSLRSVTEDGILSSDNALTAAIATALDVPTSRFVDGCVVVKRTSTGEYVEADDANGDRNAAAVVVSEEAPDGGWASTTLTVTVGDESHDIALGANDDTLAEVIAALEGDANFARLCTAADDGSGNLQITTRQKGAEAYLKVESDLDDAFTADGKEDRGEWADYRITKSIRDLIDINGSAKDRMCPMVIGDAEVDESELYFLTNDARQALRARGVVFS